MSDRVLRHYAGQTLYLAHSCGHVTQEEVSVNASNASLTLRREAERERPCQASRLAADREQETPAQRAERTRQDRDLWN